MSPEISTGKLYSIPTGRHLSGGEIMLDKIIQLIYLRSENLL
jgi:hypothetical protein